MKVSEAVVTRRSVRAFSDRSVDPALLRKLLTLAARSPSGGNTQPWNIHVVTDEALTRLKTVMADAITQAPRGEGGEYEIYPATLPDVARARIGAAGEALYGVLGVERSDREARREWFARNFRFFDAPVGLFCFVERGAGLSQWADLGMYLQTLMLLLREEGLDSCAQECWAMYPRTVQAFVGAPDSQMLFAGMAIGWKDDAHPINRLVTERAELDEFARFHA